MAGPVLPTFPAVAAAAGSHPDRVVYTSPMSCCCFWPTSSVEKEIRRRGMLRRLICMRVSRRALPGHPWHRGGSRSFPGRGDGACGRRDARCGLIWGEPLASPGGRVGAEPPFAPPSAPQFSHSPRGTHVLGSPLQPGGGVCGGCFLQGGGSPIAFVPFRPSPRL